MIAMIDSVVDFIIYNKNAIVAITAVGGLLLLIVRFAHERLRLSETIHSITLHKKMALAQGVPAFTRQEIAGALRHYVEPMCGQEDPSNESDLRQLAEVREPVMRAVDRFIQRGGDRRHILLLSDSGMGKTTFALNYYNRLSKNRKDQIPLKCAVVPLGRGNAVEHIRKITDPFDTVLILDAFDEDPDAIEGANGRMQELMSACADFAGVIVTCRSQFFADDAAIPNETGVSMIGPRRAGESGAFKFYRLYLLPFDSEQVAKYLSNTFPIWSILKRNSAKRLVQEVPELSVRPMLLALIPDLARTNAQARELFDLYGFMVDQWLERESRWISKDRLLSVSKRLAVYMFCNTPGRVQDRVTSSELAEIARQCDEAGEWKHLTARSLLNRDGSGLYKFSHRSILEYLFVLAAIEGYSECFSRPWTEFMRELFVSWGISHSDLKSVTRAREILQMDLRRTQLLPLSAPLPTPKVISVVDLIRSFTGERRDVKRRRQVPIAWRVESLKFRRTPNVIDIFDFEHDLVWRVVTTGGASDLERGIYRHNLADVSKRHADGWRLPSVAEFASLVEAERTLNSDPILDVSEYYWIGDRLGPGRHIVASLRPDLNDERLKPFEMRLPNSGSHVVRLSELKRITKKGEHTPFAAMCVMVSSGAERLWHAEEPA